MSCGGPFFVDYAHTLVYTFYVTDIITTREVQKKLGQISSSIEEKNYIVTNHGKGKVVMLPYFDGCDESIVEYMEDYLMYKNQKSLQKRYKNSKESGKSDLKV